MIFNSSTKEFLYAASLSSDIFAHDEFNCDTQHARRVKVQTKF
jgi:hypothetical protein